MDVEIRPETDHLQARGTRQAELQEQALASLRPRFGRQVFLRGVVEPSNICRESCHYCGMRRENRALDRYRADVDQLAELLVHHRPGSITDLNIQTGEDPRAVEQVVLPLLRILRAQTPLGLSVCLGTLVPETYQALREAGATIYIMKFEMAQADRYASLSAPGSLAERLEHIRDLARQGWRVSSGFIVGLPGQTDRDLLQNIHLATSLPLAGCSVSPFIPGESTPLADRSPGSLDRTLNCMALMRLARPDWIIPAVSALNLAGGRGDELEGYRRGLRSGANLVTMNLTPPRLREDYLLYKRDRFIMTEERILRALQAEGLEPSTRSLAQHCAVEPERPAVSA